MPHIATIDGNIVDKQRATPERIGHMDEANVELIKSSPLAPKGTQRVLSAPLDQLWRRGAITQREYDAGDRLRDDAYVARVDPGASSINWDATGASGGARPPTMFAAQVIADARVRFRRVQQAVTGVVWEFLSRGLLDETDFVVLGREIASIRGERHRTEQHVAGMTGLRVALGALADYYES